MDYESLRHPLQKRVNVRDVYTAFTAARDADFYFDGEMHDFWELVYVERGSAWAAEEEHVVELKENMFILHKPLAFHRIWCEGKGATFKVISFTAFGDGTARLEKRTGLLPWHLRELLTRTIERAHAVLDADGGAEGCVAAGLELLLEELAQADTTPLPKPDQADFDRIMTVINEHYRDNITLTQLAALCHMSESKLKKVFHRVYDLGVMKYVSKLRMRDAGQLLCDGVSIEEICEKLHVTDRNYFSYAFKHETGLSPREYRQKYEKILQKTS
jgi:AraC-like DNA-binding protein